MHKGLLPMLGTVFGAVGVYYLLSIRMELSETFGIIGGTVTAIIIAGLFSQREKKK